MRIHRDVKWCNDESLFLMMKEQTVIHLVNGFELCTGCWVKPVFTPFTTNISMCLLHGIKLQTLEVEILLSLSDWNLEVPNCILSIVKIKYRAWTGDNIGKLIIDKRSRETFSKYSTSIHLNWWKVHFDSIFRPRKTSNTGCNRITCRWEMDSCRKLDNCWKK